jgi:hypothetical protein
MAVPGRASPRDIESLMDITMKLMQKSAYKKGAGGAHDEKRWPADCRAFDFLTKIQGARSFDKLLEVSRAFHNYYCA